MDLKQYVSEVQDWPKPGVSFKDITTIMDNGEAYGSGASGGTAAIPGPA